MLDLAKVLQEQQAVGVKAAGAQGAVVHMDVPGRPSVGLRIERGSEGSVEVEEYTKEIPARDHSAESLDGLCGVVARFARTRPPEGDALRPVETEAMGDVEVWVDRECVLAVLDGGAGRRENTALLTLQYTDQFEAVRRLYEAQGPAAWLDQKATIELLRDQVNGLYEPHDIVQVLRNLKFSSAGSAEGLVTAGRESLGRSVQNELAGWKDEYETLHISVPVFDNVFTPGGEPYEALVECTLSADLAAQRFRIKPRAGELARVEHEVCRKVMEQVRAATAGLCVTVFHGSANLDTD